MISIHNGSVPILNFPDFYIVAPGSGRKSGGASSHAKTLQVVGLEKASPAAFNAWLCFIESIEGVTAFPRSNEWSIAERYQAISALAEHGVDMTKYLHCGKVSARQALEALQPPLPLSEAPTLYVKVVVPAWSPRLRLPVKLVAVSQEVQSA